jgi:quinoprotein glucose dehydrogenase
MSGRAMRMTGCGAILLAATVCATLSVSGQTSSQQSGTRSGEWRYWGGDAFSSRYSPLDEINQSNVKNLKIAWRWKTDNFGFKPDFNYQATPLMIGGVLYTTAGSRRDVVAIDAGTGETLWMYRLDEGRRGLMSAVRSVSGRGVAYWSDGREARILHVTQGYRLVALDAKTGAPVPTFGKNGVVDLYEDNDQELCSSITARPLPATCIQDGQYGLNSPPLVIRDTVVVGAALLASPPTRAFVKGYVRGFDVRTGKRTWIFHTIPQPGEFGNDTWEKDSWSYTGNTGVWGELSADEDLGYVYFGVETPTNDNSGAERPGDNLFSDSVLCLDAKTGKRVWYFQLLHHGIWDYDIPTAPNLVDVTVAGQRIKALAQVTKQGYTYVFDRVTGKSIWPMPETPVPQSDMPGEKMSKTQPIPTRPPAFEMQGVTPDDLINFTPDLHAEAMKIISDYIFAPLYTPPVKSGVVSQFNPQGKKAVLMSPVATGGANWQGAAVDLETGILYVSSVTGISGVGRGGGEGGGGGGGRGGSPAPGLPTGQNGVDGFNSGNVLFHLESDGNATRRASVGCGEPGPQGLPLVKPPYGRITAQDLNTGANIFTIANGPTPDCIANHPALKGLTIPRTGKPERSGVLVTKTLLFAGEGSGLLVQPSWSGGPMLYAYDKKTGATVAEFTLPSNQSGIPMTYMLNGKQYIAVPVGGRNQPAELVALTLP